jgi:preprotein translocase subunit SecB
MTVPVCQLEDFHFTRLSVLWHEPQESVSVEVHHSFDYEIGRHKTDVNCYRLEFRFNVAPGTPEPVGYVIDTEIVGFFRIAGNTSPEKADYLALLNGCTILYGILRGQIAALTGCFPQEKFVLPSVMMEDVIRDVEQQKAAAITPVARKPAKKPAKAKKK